ncbi:MAG TPA: transcriptional regulator GcvA [Burkholderiales bacterium]|nr:transcriptional regulator GcvA [Burkholderiales bacterium]
MQNRNVKTVPRLPSLDLLKGFEAAARLLSFTKAADELHLTQSAVSRQIQDLEQQLGVPLFQRRHRSLVLTEAGQQLFSAAAQVLSTMRAVTDRLRAQTGRRVLSVTTMTSFAALWLVPRLTGFAREHPGIDVRIATDPRMSDLEREGLDVGIRYCTAESAGRGAIRLFGEQVFPVCSPKLAADPKRPLGEPADLRRHILLQYDDPEGFAPWLNWKSWLELVGVPDLRPAGSVLLSGYEQIIPAAIAGQGVALGRSPLVREPLAAGTLVAPFSRMGESSRAYFVVVSQNAAGREEVANFLRWLRAEAAREDSVPAISRERRPAPKRARS